jgi:hypothetical protein
LLKSQFKLIIPNMSVVVQSTVQCTGDNLHGIRQSFNFCQSRKI